MLIYGNGKNTMNMYSMINKWNPEADACDICKECDYFLHDYWNCQGEPEPCWEFFPRIGSKYRKINLTVTNEVNDENN